jgi:EpsI family protein
MLTRISILCACLLAASAYVARAHRPQALPPRHSLAALPLSIGGWEGRDASEISDQIVSSLGVDDYANRFYAGPDGNVLSLYVGYYQSQRQGASIHSPLNCLPGAGWNPVKHEFLEISVGNTKIEINRIVVLKGLEKQVVLYWYQSHARVVASEYQAKMYSVLDALRTGRTDAALVRIVSPAASFDQAAEDAAAQRAAAFVQQLYPLLSGYIPE